MSEYRNYVCTSSAARRRGTLEKFRPVTMTVFMDSAEYAAREFNRLYERDERASLAVCRETPPWNPDNPYSDLPYGKECVGV